MLKVEMKFITMLLSGQKHREELNAKITVCFQLCKQLINFAKRGAHSSKIKYSTMVAKFIWFITSPRMAFQL